MFSTDSLPLIVLMTVAAVAIVVTVTVALVSGRFDRQPPPDGEDGTRTATTGGSAPSVSPSSGLAADYPREATIGRPLSAQATMPPPSSTTSR